MVLAKEVAAERDAAARFIPWLATFGSVSPLLGLLGTVLGVMDAFIGIAVGGSGNIGAVAPGVAEALVTTVAGLAGGAPPGVGPNPFLKRLWIFSPGACRLCPKKYLPISALRGRPNVSRGGE